jgi:hypothetical protein
MRDVICHYHIYKNAGTSFDHILQSNLGDRHLSFDGPFPFFTIDQEQLDRIILRKIDAVAFSSHQIQLPAPRSGVYRVHSVLFVRNPYLRAASIWRFKRTHPDGTETSARAAKLDFPAWVAACLDDPQEVSQISNAQTRLIGAAFRERAAARRMAGRMEYDLRRALDNLSGVTHVGRTETFAADATRIVARLNGFGFELQLPPDLHLNATSRDARPASERVSDVLAVLGPELADRLVAANDQDEAICAAVDTQLAHGKAAA